MKLSVYYKGLHWPHILFFTLTPVIAVISILWISLTTGLRWETGLLALVMLILAGLSTTAGYHRLFSHKTYEARWPARLFFLLFGAAAFQGSVRWWASGHRNHHLYTDTPKDPYGINKGFWYAHIGWLFTHDQEISHFENVKDLDADAWIRWQDRLFPLVAVGIGWILPALMAMLWSDFWGGFFVCVNYIFVFCLACENYNIFTRSRIQKLFRYD